MARSVPLSRFPPQFGGGSAFFVRLLAHVMNRRVIRFLIAVALVVEIFWALEPRNGLLPRSPETVQAIHAYQASPSDATKATMLQQFHLDSARNARHDQILLGVMLLADIVVIYFFWNYGVTKPAA